MPYLNDMATASIHSISHSELQELVLPALACLPIAFVSARPPDAFLPLLSPILRQRVHLFSSSTDQSDKAPSQRETWLSLLSWSRERAQQLADVVSTLQLEAHPVSGEVELFGDGTDPDAGKIWYRKLDLETTQARCNLQEYKIAFVWVWCDNDTGGTGLEALSGQEPGSVESGWRIAEVLPVQGDEDMDREGWFETLDAAERSAAAQQPAEVNGSAAEQALRGSTSSEGTGGDDDYWAAYDRTPGKTSRMPSSENIHNPSANGLRRMDSEDYFSRYASEVQPAMDPHDPDEAPPDQEIESTLKGGSEYTAQRTTSTQVPVRPTGDVRRASRERSDTLRPHEFARYETLLENQAPNALDHTYVPPSPSVASLEASAENMLAVETTVRQHISGEVKHLYRLARGVGIDHEDFKAMMERETELLGLLGLDN